MKSSWFLSAVAAIWLSIPAQVCAETYFLRADGQAKRKDDAVGCQSPATAMNVRRHNAERFSPGDRIVLCAEGGIFRSTITLPSSGTEESPIILDGLGTAVVSGSDLVGEWTWVSESVFRAGADVRPQQVFIDGVFGNRMGNRWALEEDGDWYWELGSLYLFSSKGHPDDVFDDPGIEAGARDVAFDFSGRDYIAIEGVAARHANLSGFKAWNPGSNTSIRRCIAEWNWNVGIDFHGDSAYSDVVVEDSIARFNGEGGIALYGPGTDSVIRRNTVYENGKFQSADRLFESDHQWTFGIKLWEDRSIQKGIEIYHNKAYENGRGKGDDQQGQGVGIWIDGVPGNPQDPNIVRHNLVFGNAGNGIYIEISSNSVVFSNVLHNNATNMGGKREWTPANIAIDARQGYLTEGNVVVNNTIFGGRIGIKVVTYERDGCRVNDNVVKNNIAALASEHALYARFGGDNDGSHGSGNVYEHNNFGMARASFINWGKTRVDTYEEWDSAYGRATHSVEGDPGFVGRTPQTLSLTSGSPCRDTGERLQMQFSEGLTSAATWTENVTTDNHDSHGLGWDLGAYIVEEDTRRRAPARRQRPVGPPG